MGLGLGASGAALGLVGAVAVGRAGAAPGLRVDATTGAFAFVGGALAALAAGASSAGNTCG